MTEAGSTPPEIVSGDELDDDVVSVVSVERSDEVATVCGRVDSAPSYWVIVHAPRGNRALSTDLGMHRLRRHAEESGRLIAIATRSPALAGRARALQIPVAGRPEYVRWDAPGKSIFRLGGRSFAVPAAGRYIQLAILTTAVLFAAALAVSIVPAARVTVFPQADLLSATIDVTAPPDLTDPEIDALRLPATTVTATTVVTLALPTTGSAPLGQQPATVTLTISNSTASAVTVPEGSIVLTGTGIAFTTTAAATAPAGAAVAISATSALPGADKNVAAGTLVRWEDATRFPGLTVTNAAAATGGTSISVPAVDSRDIVTLRELEADVRNSDAVRSFLALERPHDAVFLETAEIDGEEVEEPPSAGTPTDLLLVRYRLTISARAIDAATLERVARAVLSDGNGGEFIPGTVSAVQVPGTAAVGEDGTLTASFEISGHFAHGFSSDDVRNAVKGRSMDDAKSTLQERYGIQDAVVELTPGFAPWLPRFDFRIQVDLREQLTESAGDPAPGDEDANDSDTG
ncbi:MAG TPA: baseplate J/gp47 family protein [Tepidiformaceae bacterium]|nr:baseplate J/gp47 family protein [Tepidiformaceae bacterium]